MIIIGTFGTCCFSISSRSELVGGGILQINYSIDSAYD